MTDILLALLFSFTCTTGFGICFGIRPSELYLAGLGGVVTRIVLMICEPAFPNRLVYTMIAAAVATLFAETYLQRLSDSRVRSISRLSDSIRRSW